MWWLGGLAWGIEGVNRCRGYLRYQKTQKLKISKFELTPLIQMWAVIELSQLISPLYCPNLDKGCMSNFNFSSKWRKRETCFFFKKTTFESPPPQKKKEERCLRSDSAGEGDGGGGGFPLPAPQGKFWDITTLWLFLASETQFNSLLSSHNTLK